MFLKPKTKHIILTCLIALVWLVNGLFAKVLNFVPRHEQIVARILGETNSVLIIKTIGIGEIFMAVWVLSKILSRVNAITQIFLVALMNILEFLIAKDLLLFGAKNALIALIFITVVYYNEFILSKQIADS